MVEGARLESVFCALNPARLARRPDLPRSRHLPLASTDGSLTRNLNKTRVRLWAGWTAQPQPVFILLLVDINK